MNRMRLVLLCALVGIPFMAGCGGDTARMSEVTAPRVIRVPESPSTDIDLDALNLDYEVLSGTLSPGAGGLMTKTLTTWGKNCSFTLIVPENALNPEDPPVTFTMRVPTKASYQAHPELDSLLIVRLAPDGNTFRAPITIQCTWKPWQFNGTPPTPMIYFSGPESGPATVEQLANGRWRVSFSVGHFSDWEVGPDR